MSESKILPNSANLMNPIRNINGYLTSTGQIFDESTGKSQDEINRTITNGGISNVQHYYAVNASRVEYPPIGQFRDDKPVWIPVPWVSVPGYYGEPLEMPQTSLEFQYLWKYSVITYIDGRVRALSPEFVGEYIFGAAGDLKLIYKIEYFYQVTPSGDPDQEFDETLWKDYSQPTDNKNRFIWEKQNIYYTDKPEEIGKVVYHCIGVQGEPGVDGSDIEYFYIQSKSNLTGEDVEFGKPSNPTPDNWEKSPRGGTC